MKVHSSQVASFLGTVHHEYVFTVEEALDALPDVRSLRRTPHETCTSQLLICR